MYCPPNYSERHYKDIKNYTKQAGLFVPLVLCNNFADLYETSAHLHILHNANVQMNCKISLIKCNSCKHPNINKGGRLGTESIPFLLLSLTQNHKQYATDRSVYFPSELQVCPGILMEILPP